MRIVEVFQATQGLEGLVKLIAWATLELFAFVGLFALERGGGVRFRPLVVDRLSTSAEQSVERLLDD
jgi:hypothetical protein